MVTALKNTGNRIDLTTIGILLLLYVIVFTVSKTNGTGIDEWPRNKRTGIISCTPYSSANDLNAGPTGDNNGTGCMHQPVVAALPGQRRSKRATMHTC